MKILTILLFLLAATQAKAEQEISLTEMLSIAEKLGMEIDTKGIIDTEETIWYSYPGNRDSAKKKSRLARACFERILPTLELVSYIHEIDSNFYHAWHDIIASEFNSCFLLHENFKMER